MGGAVHRQEGHKTRILSTTAPRRPGRTQFMEYPAPATVLPLSILIFKFLYALRGKFFLFWVHMAASCHMTRNVYSRLHSGGFGHAQVLYKSTTCYRHTGRRDDNRIFVKLVRAVRLGFHLTRSTCPHDGLYRLLLKSLHSG
jgi:hypothetical protein